MNHLIFLPAIAVLLLSGCVVQESGKYFEVVYQAPVGCNEGLCFDEVLAMEDGLVFVKQRYSGGDYEVSFCTANQEKLQQLFSFLDSHFAQSRLVECNSCELLHIFYNNGKETFFSSIPAKEQVFESEFYEAAGEICSGPAEAELIHVIIGKGQQYLDYHAFSNGTLVFERFGLKEGELLESRVSKISGEEFSELKGMVPNEFFSPGAASNCPSQNFFYGFVEVFADGKYNAAFTCGGDTPAGTAFERLAGRLLQ